MPHVDQIIAEFGRRMGLPALRMKENAPLQLEMEGRGSLFLERAGEDLLVYLARSFPPHDRQAARRALALCHHGKAPAFPVRAGMYGDSVLFFLVRVKGTDCTISTVEKVVPFLAWLLDQTFVS